MDNTFGSSDSAYFGVGVAVGSGVLVAVAVGTGVVSSVDAGGGVTVEDPTPASRVTRRVGDAVAVIVAVVVRVRDLLVGVNEGVPAESLTVGVVGVEAIAETGAAVILSNLKVATISVSAAMVKFLTLQL